MYHLGALRSLQGIFSNAQEDCVRRAVAAALEGCVGFILEKIKVSERTTFSTTWRTTTAISSAVDAAVRAV